MVNWNRVVIGVGSVYADDFVIPFRHENDARRVMEVLPKVSVPPNASCGAW